MNLIYLIYIYIIIINILIIYIYIFVDMKTMNGNIYNEKNNNNYWVVYNIRLLMHIII